MFRLIGSHSITHIFAVRMTIPDEFVHYRTIKLGKRKLTRNIGAEFITPEITIWLRATSNERVTIGRKVGQCDHAYENCVQIVTSEVISRNPFRSPGWSPQAPQLQP